MKYFALTDVGKKREINEDSYYLPKAGENFCMVADGMGGHNAGEVASAMAVDVFTETLRKRGKITEKRLLEAVKNANEKVFKAAQENGACSGMGTTLTALSANRDSILVVQVGDSRCYRVRDGKTKKITHDHSLIQEMLDNGLITPLEAENSPYRNLITRAVGTREEVKADTYSLTAEMGDVFLLCSDGLSNHVTEAEIAEITSCKGPTWQEKLQKLIDLALADGGPDNITAVYAVFAEGKK